MPITLFPSPDEGIRCLLQSAGAAPGLADGIPPPGLLAPQEQERLASLRVPKRRRDWLLGRWTAKQLVRAHLGEAASPPSPDAILILARADGSPYASLLQPPGVDPLPFSLSISHSGDHSFCALTALPGAAIGADIEMAEPRPLSLAEQFFALDELAAILARPEAERDLLITLVWSAKEAFLKCIREGLRVDTRAVRVEVPPQLAGFDSWQPVRVAPEPDLLPLGAAYRSWFRPGPRSVLALGVLSSAHD